MNQTNKMETEEAQKRKTKQENNGFKITQPINNTIYNN